MPAEETRIITRRLHERPEIREPPHVIELLDRAARFGQCHDVGGLALADELRDVAVYEAMGFAVEVVRRDDIADFVRGVVVEQQAAQHRLLRLDGVRRQLQGIDLQIVGHSESDGGAEPDFTGTRAIVPSGPRRNCCR